MTPQKPASYTTSSPSSPSTSATSRIPKARALPPTTDDEEPILSIGWVRQLGWSPSIFYHVQHITPGLQWVSPATASTVVRDVNRSTRSKHRSRGQTGQGGFPNRGTTQRRRSLLPTLPHLHRLPSLATSPRTKLYLPPRKKIRRDLGQQYLFFTDCSAHNRSHRAALSHVPSSGDRRGKWFTHEYQRDGKVIGQDPQDWNVVGQDRIREALQGISVHGGLHERQVRTNVLDSVWLAGRLPNLQPPSGGPGGQTSKLPTLRRFTLTATAVGKIEEGKIAHPISKQLEISSRIVIPTGNQQPRRAIPTTAPRRLTMPSDQFLHTVYLNRPGKLPGTQSKYFSSRLLDMEQSTPPTPFNYHPLDSNAINPVATLPVDALTCVCEQLESSSAKDVTMLKHEVNQTNYSARRFNTRRPLNFSRGSLNPFLLSFSPSPAVALPACGCSHPPSPTITSDQDLGCRALSLMEEVGFAIPHPRRTSLITANENTHNAGHYIQLFPQGDVSFHYLSRPQPTRHPFTFASWLPVTNARSPLSRSKVTAARKSFAQAVARNRNRERLWVCRPDTRTACRFTFSSRHPFKKAAPPDDNIAPLESDCVSVNASSDIPSMGGSRTIAIPTLSNPTTRVFFPIRSPSLAIERSVGEIVPADDPMDAYKDETVPHGSRLPFVAISSREHSMYRSRRRGSRGSDGSSAAEVLQYLPQHSRTSIADIRLNDIPEDIGSPTGPTDTPNGLHGGTAPGVSTRAPSNPLRPIRTRGAFIIGNGAPIKIDDSLEVHLRDGADGQVDFII
ncbi:hypothetical protein BJ322DRAFT_1017423 [Thelephora terrestris]|uniref:Uncharacterized protein n=1 Tax=Thelephora terrestris TaxID=56493 RepID=A0A9P6HNB0_9AGAM|nr:hypothetical protein BJ322DRAFT_1017423 [Thelephora terrestris]